MGLLSFYESSFGKILRVRIGYMIFLFGLCVTAIAWLSTIYDRPEIRLERVRGLG
jgi:hypothetical protein